MDALFAAIRSGDAAAVASLLDADPSLVDAKSGNTSALLLAIYHGHPDIARLFAGRRQHLTLHEAIALGDADRAMAMLDADPAALDRFSDDGFPPLGLAIFFRHPALARTLIERGANVNAAASNAQRVAPLHAAAAVRDAESVQLLLARGADPNARQQSDYTPLHSAASNGDLTVARLLLDAGADPAATSSDGKTPADIARERGHGWT